MATSPAERFLIFDLDGTLIDSEPGIRASLALAFEAAGRKLPAGDIRRVIGPPIRVIAARLEPALTEDELVTIERTYRAHYDGEGWRATVAFPDVGSVLEGLRKDGAALFIVTNKPRLPTARILDHLGLLSLFVDVSTRDSRQPPYGSKAEMVRALLDRHAIPSAGTLLVGDTAEDHNAAAENALGFVHAAYGYGAAEQPDHSIDSFAELTQLAFDIGERPAPTHT